MIADDHLLRTVLAALSKKQRADRDGGAPLLTHLKLTDKFDGFSIFDAAKLGSQFAELIYLNCSFGAPLLFPRSFF